MSVPPLTSSDGADNGPPFGRRILFLDDDRIRAEVFLAETSPEAVWVETVQDCLARLEESWDEVHLDHDLGGERFVDCERDDCGMAIVRWLCLEPRPHLNETQFIVHSHNAAAVEMMVQHMREAGYNVEAHPFGPAVASFRPIDELEARPAWNRSWLERLQDFARRLSEKVVRKSG